MMDTSARVMVAVLEAVPDVTEYLGEDTIGMIKAAAGYAGIRVVMKGAVFGSVFGYLSGGNLSDASNRMVTAVARAYTETVDIAYREGGGEPPIDEETAVWARAQIEEQFTFIDQLFVKLKELRKEGNIDPGEYASARAEAYASALDGFYNAIVLMGAKNKMLTWNLGATEKHCKDCAKLNGQRHKASWYISRGYFPRKPGSNTECGGYNCDCTLTDDKGNEVTI